MTQSHVESITTAILLASVGIFILFERLRPYRTGLQFFRKGFWVDLVWYTLIQSYFLKIIIFDWIIYPLDKHFQLSTYFHLLSGWPVWCQVLFFLITHDLYIYWFHRTQHHSKWLWRTHEAHHSVKEVDWLAGSRSHSIEIIINQTIEFAPIILLGANPVVVPIKVLIDAVWGMFIHSNIDVKIGKAQYIINTPAMHQWHHADRYEVFYSNYSTKFSFWDFIFDTAYFPGFKPDVYGLPYEYPDDYFLQHAYSMKRFDYLKLYKNKFFNFYAMSRVRCWQYLVNLFTFKKTSTRA